MNISPQLDALLALSIPRTRFWITDSIATPNDRHFDDAVTDFVRENATILGGNFAKALANAILCECGHEEYFSEVGNFSLTNFARVLA